MTNSKNTKRALLASVLSVLLCIVMLVGTTFAWFTDSVTSSGNIIKSGTLDVAMMWANGTEDPEGTKTTWKDASEDAIFNNDLWEPGYAEVRHVKISNNGTLALKYKLSIAATDEVSELADVIDVYYINGGQQIEKRGDLPADSWVGTLAQVLANTDLAKGHIAGKKDNVVSSDMATIALKMREDAGNEYQGKGIGSDFAIQLVATQYTAEADSFDDQYDQGALYPWDGTSVAPGEPDASGNTELSTPENLAWLAEEVNKGSNFKGKTFTLTEDINLGDEPWTPIGTNAKPFNGTFNGNGHTITNIAPVTTADGYTGLFGKTNGATITDLTIKGGNVNSTQNNVGAVAGNTSGGKLEKVVVEDVVVNGKDNVGGLVGNSFTAALENCTIKNSTITGSQYTGGITGTSYSKMKNLVVENCTINSKSWKVGGIVGQLNEGTFTLNDLTVNDCVIKTPSTSCIGGIIGFSNYGNKTLNNCHVLNCTMQLNSERSGSLTGVAGMIGQACGNNGNIISFNNCEVSKMSVIADVSGQKASGVGAYIGNGYWRGYTGVTVNFNNCAADIDKVSAASGTTDVGAFVGNSGSNNTYNFVGANSATGAIKDIFGTLNSTSTVTGEDTIKSRL